MGRWLTYMRNRKGDPNKNRVPDENYAREIMQLFSIGLIELNADGSPRLDESGAQIETYDNEDVTQLARVFTGLNLQHTSFFGASQATDSPSLFQPMMMFDDQHSDLQKEFLGTIIPASTPGEQSIDIALDTLVNHANTPPFISRQLIQRFVTSNPSNAYIERVATAFSTGLYQLPDGSEVGEGRRGDLTATLAAILFDDEARSATVAQSDSFGKIREPFIRFTNWARALGVTGITPEFRPELWDLSSSDTLAQQPYGAPSVFNFYRPGYVAPNTESGHQGLVAPELQILDATSVTSYANFMLQFITGDSNGSSFATDEQAAASFVTNYTDELTLANDAEALVEHLDNNLTYGSMSEETQDSISDALNIIPLTSTDDPDYDGARLRVEMAILMAMTSPDYIVQR